MPHAALAIVERFERPDDVDVQWILPPPRANFALERPDAEENAKEHLEHPTPAAKELLRSCK